MNLFFVEGYSEEHFIRSYLALSGLNWTIDVSEYLHARSNNYIINCKSDTTIMPTIRKNKWLFTQPALKGSIIWIVSDAGVYECFSSIYRAYETFFKEEDIKNNFYTIISKPYLEVQYFHNIEHIKHTVKALYNFRNPQNILDSADQLKENSLLTSNSPNKNNVLKDYCRINLGGFNKRTFAKKFFHSLHMAKHEVPITSRLKRYLNLQMPLDI
jgi:hypothetical protein